MNARHRLGGEIGPAFEEIVERLEAILQGIAEDVDPAFLDLPSYDRDSHIREFPYFGRMLRA